MAPPCVSVEASKRRCSSCREEATRVAVGRYEGRRGSRSHARRRAKATTPRAWGGFHQARIFNDQILLLCFLRPTADWVYFGQVCTLPSLSCCASGYLVTSATTTVILQASTVSGFTFGDHMGAPAVGQAPNCMPAITPANPLDA